MNWKILLALFIIIAITGLLIFSEKGRGFREKYLDKYIKSVGSYLTGIKSKFIKPKAVNRTLEITISTDSTNLRGQEFELTERPFKVELIYDAVSVGGQNIDAKGSENIDFKTDSMTGNIVIDENDKMKFSGQAGNVELNEIVFSSKSGEEKIEFYLVGTPISFSLIDVEKDSMIFSDISGSLKLGDWSPLTLKNDNLNIVNFKGTIEYEEDSLTITGDIEKASLNGVDLSLKI